MTKDKAVLQVITAYTARRNEELRAFGAYVNHAGRAGTEMNALMEACETLAQVPSEKKVDDVCWGIADLHARSKVYIAAPWELRDEAIRVKGVLEAREYEVTSTWLTTLDEEGDKGARMDLADVARADMLLLLNPEEYRRIGTGGRHCEFMYAWSLGKQIVILGVRSNIFHHLSNVRVITRLEEL